MGDFKDFRRAGTQKYDDAGVVLREFIGGASIEDLSGLYNESEEAVENLVRMALAYFERHTSGTLAGACDRIDFVRRGGRLREGGGANEQ